MGIESIKKTIDGMDFTIQQFQWNKAIDLETLTLTIIAPSIDLLENFKGFETEMDLKRLGSILRKVLLSFRKEDPFAYAKKMLAQTFFHDSEKGNLLLDNIQNINAVFTGKTLTCMKLLIEVMKANNFAFIEGLGGKGINLIGFLTQMQTKQTSSEKK